MAKNKELNQWASLKKATQIRPEHVERNEIGLYKAKGRNETLKRKILQSLYGEPSDDDEEVVVANEPKSDKITVKTVENFQIVEISDQETQFAEEAPTYDVKLEKSKINKKKKKLSADSIGTQTKKAKKNKVEIIETITEAAPISRADKNISLNSVPLKKELKTTKKIIGKNKLKKIEKIGKIKMNKSTNVEQIKLNKSNKVEKFGTAINIKSIQNKTMPGGSKNLVQTPKKSGNKKNNGISDERLRAFGINPKKYHKKQKWESGGRGSANKQQQSIAERPVAQKSTANSTVEAGQDGKQSAVKKRKIIKIRKNY